MKKKKARKVCQAKNMHIEFSAGRLTNYSGIQPVYTFMQKLDVFNLISKMIDLPLHHNKRYATSQIIGAIVLGLNSGLNRISKIESFTNDALAQHLLDLPGKIDEDTIVNRFRRFNLDYNNDFNRLIGILSQKVHKKLNVTADILDVDSTPRVVYGNQEGAAKGFNHTKKGAKSYHPLLSFLNRTKECLSAWLRPGDAYTSNNAEEFLRATFQQIPKGIKRLLVRADSGFFSDKIISLIEGDKNKSYLIKVKLKGLEELLSRQEWEKVEDHPGFESCCFYHKCNGWKRARRFIGIRKKEKTYRKEDGYLFDVFTYQYSCPPAGGLT